MINPNSAEKLRSMIDKAMDDHQITRAEMDIIIHLATEDGHIDRTEQAMLDQLHEMIENKMLKVVP